MFLIAGLGNPDKKYEKTRHNIGFDTVDALAEKYNISITEKKHKSAVWKRCDRRRKSHPGQTADLYEFKRRKHRRNREFL